MADRISVLRLPRCRLAAGAVESTDEYGEYTNEHLRS